MRLMLARTVLSAALLLLAASSAQAVTLDNFEEGAFSLSTLPGVTFDEVTQSGLSPLNVLSGERILLLDFIGSTSNPGASSSELVLTGGDDAASFTANSELGKRLEVIYLFASPVDLTAMGAAFSIELESLVDSAGAFSFLVGVESNGGFGESNVEVSALTPGTITVPFSALVGVADLSQADSIFFQLRTTDGALGSVSATIDNFQIVPVPEPGTGLLQLTAMLVVAGLSRRRVRSGLFGFAQAA